MRKHREKSHSFSNYNFPDYLDYAQGLLRKWLEMLCFPITLPLLINGHFETQNKNKPDEWKYRVSFGKDEHGNVFLHVEARFTAEIGTRYEAFFPIPTSEIKKSLLIRDLIHHMCSNRMEPGTALAIDGKDHEYDTYVDGKHQKARYVAYWKSFNNEGPALICSYGLVRGGKQFTYSSSEQ